MENVPAGSLGLASGRSKMSRLGTQEWSRTALCFQWPLLFAFSGHSHPKSGLDREYQQDFSPVIITVPCSKADVQSLCGRLVPFTCLQNAGSRGDRKHFQVVLPFLFICNERSKYQIKQYKQYKALCVCAACCTQNNASPCQPTNKSHLALPEAFCACGQFLFSSSDQGERSIAPTSK